MYKTFPNSIYGKFGQCGESFVVGPETREWREKVGEEPEENGTRYEDYFGWIVQRRPDTIAAYANMIWAGYITAAAREQIHAYIVALKALYTDTDSVFTLMPVAKTDALGELALKYKTSVFE